MIPLIVKKHGDGDIRIGWASWDEGRHEKAIKYAYRDKTGKISRGSPEVSFDVLVAMVTLALRKGELSKRHIARIRAALPPDT